MEPQILELILTELKHKISWKSIDIPLDGPNQLLRFLHRKAQLNRYSTLLSDRELPLEAGLNISKTQYYSNS